MIDGEDRRLGKVRYQSIFHNRAVMLVGGGGIVGEDGWSWSWEILTAYHIVFSQQSVARNFQVSYGNKNRLRCVPSSNWRNTSDAWMRTPSKEMELACSKKRQMPLIPVPSRGSVV